MRNGALQAIALLLVSAIALASGCGNSLAGSAGASRAAPRSLVASVPALPAAAASVPALPAAAASVPALPRPGRAAAVGDSIVAHGAFVGVLNRLPGYRWENRGLRGANTANIRFRTPRRSYGEILIMGGLNDFSPRVDSTWTIANLRDSYLRAREAGARVVAVTSTPCRGSARWTVEEQRDQDEVNRWILGGADGLVDVAVDAYAALESPRGSDQIDPRFAQPDRLHLNRDGQRRLAEVIIETAYRGVAVD
jgi:hypothetical protein